MDNHNFGARAENGRRDRLFHGPIKWVQLPPRPTRSWGELGESYLMMNLRRIQRGLMRTCSKCQKETDIVVVDMRLGKAYCERCANLELSYCPGYTLSETDLFFLRNCGIDPQVKSALDFILESSRLAQECAQRRDQGGDQVKRLTG
jgi:hypothetical protein